MSGQPNRGLIGLLRRDKSGPTVKGKYRRRNSLSCLRGPYTAYTWCGRLSPSRVRRLQSRLPCLPLSSGLRPGALPLDLEPTRNLPPTVSEFPWPSKNRRHGNRDRRSAKITPPSSSSVPISSRASEAARLGACIEPKVIQNLCSGDLSSCRNH